jgi:hypothetical protein
VIRSLLSAYPFDKKHHIVLHHRAVVRHAGPIFLSVLLPICCALAQSPPLPRSARPQIHYRLEPISGGIHALEKRYSLSQLLLLEKLNRRDLVHLVRLKEMAAPDQWYYNELIYSPMPDSYGWAAPYPNIIIVEQKYQVFGAYELGQLVRWGPVSTGRKSSPTPNGFYNLKWKARIHHSTDNQEWCMPWYFNFINFRGLGFHQYEMPGYPASHSCVRLLEEDAEWLYDWGDQWELDTKCDSILQKGTPVLVIGEYEHGQPPPWHDLQNLLSAIHLPVNPLPAEEAVIKP